MKINPKIIGKPKFCRIFIGLLFIGFSNFFYGQEKVNLYATIGVPETINIGARYQFEQAQAGVGFFVMPHDEGTNYFVSADALIHLWGESELSNRKPWFFKTGFTYLYNETAESIEKWTFLDTRIGRDFNISRKVGISFGLGLAFRLTYDEEIKKVSEDWDFFDTSDWPIWPSIGITLFYRL